MNKGEKEEAVAEVKDLLSNSASLFLTDFSGINVEDINRLRREFRKEGVKYKVIKNTLLKRAVHEVGGYDDIIGELVGMNGFAFSTDNPVAPAKIIKKYFDENSKLTFKGCYIESQYYNSGKLNELASIPSKKELIASILGSISSPASGIVGAINGVIRDLVNVIDQIAQKKETA